MTQITFTVTAEDIAAGRQMHGERCPIGRAVRRVWPNAHVTAVSILPGGFGKLYGDIPLDDQAFAFVRKFDTGFPVEPFSFTVVIPDA